MQVTRVAPGWPVPSLMLAQQTIQRRRRVRDPAVLPHFAAQAARRHRDDNAVLVNIEPNVSDTIRHDPSPMLGGDGMTLRFCYEAGPCGYGIQRRLSTGGHECVVV